MTLTVTDAYLAELNGMKLLADLPRPKVPFAPEMIHGAFCLWRTNGNGSHMDNIRLNPKNHASVIAVLRGARSSSLRVRGGSLLVRAVEGTIGEDEIALLDRLASSPRSTGYIMARSLEYVMDEPQPALLDGDDCLVRTPESLAEYLEVRRLVAGIFGGGASAYDPEADFYSAPDHITTIAVWERGKVISAASILVVNEVANVWSVCTQEAARGHGAASVVVHACLIEARRQGAHAAVLGTSRDLAKPGGLYNRLGFETLGNEHGWTLKELDRLAESVF